MKRQHVWYERATILEVAAIHIAAGLAANALSAYDRSRLASDAVAYARQLCDELDKPETAT